MTPDRIKAIRAALGESVDKFGERFKCSGRTIENWEQGRREPSGLCVAIMAALETQIKPKRKGTR